MWAYNLHKINDLRFENVADPICSDDEVLVEVKAAGICGSDIPRVFSTGTYHFPTIIGHEFSGVIKGTSIRVGVFPLIPCNNCKQCSSKHYDMCESYGYLGSRQDGGFAQYVKVPKWNLIELPSSVSYEQGAMLEPMSVAVHAIRKSKVNLNNSVVVQGLGTIGIFVVMFLKEMGISNIKVIGSKEIQKDFANELCVDFIDRTSIPDNLQSDIYFDCVGTNEVMINAINYVHHLGKVICVGNPHSDFELSKQVYWKILRKQLTLIGTWNSSYTRSDDADWHSVLNKLEQKVIPPEKFITHRYNYLQLPLALESMKNKNAYIKEMIII